MLSEVIEIVRGCGELLMRRDFDSHTKSTESDYVTSADIAVQERLKRQLSALDESYGFLGEEGGEADPDGNMWVVDPIDGTANFVRDIGASVISVGLVKRGEPTLGVIYNPYRNEMFWAQKGKGAFLNGRPIHVSERDMRHSMFCTALCVYDHSLAGPCINILGEMYRKCDDFRRIGSAALELAYLACGRAELYFEIRIFPWDFAAGQILIEEAGGFVGAVGVDRPVFDRPIPFFCANTRENFDVLRQTILKEIPTVPYND